MPLYLVATPIGNRGDITLRAIEMLKASDLIACEDTRTSKPFLVSLGIDSPLFPYHDHNAEGARPKLLEKLLQGESISLITDAGMPLISDPGYKLVLECQRLQIPYTVIPGASAVLAGLCLSGLPPYPFYFGGFLPNKSKARQDAFRNLKNLPATLVFFESPHRIGASIKDALEVLGNRDAALVREITKKFEEVRHLSLQDLFDSIETNPPKGEMVLLISGEGKDDENSIKEIEKRLKILLKSYSTKEAVSALKDETGKSKKELYALALHLQDKL
ncbi:16S rRNA (cytidine(1402)-2'-O)-methyltransferase [Candidatus Bealeia paramacronuclearis]|uniref:Ribosomal RNA small subunit methyltransferase I n=1 Tax=Candidatus Bealeia paramacronuclearis TaxID=1921001 RepID=A0ABZ2C4I0_9PROT|nr:16S rRNA (cytidine(1402)-2'-O)-methyltransferase [Candidatus Bealeia paramacronuclearis]